MKGKAKSWWLMLLKGTVLVILSFFVFQHPIASLEVLAGIIGIVFVFTGIILILASNDHSDL